MVILKSSMISFLVFFTLTLFAWFFPLYLGTKGFVFFDMSILIDGAWRILLGQVPYRDFSVLYGPLPFYMQALFLKIFKGQLFSAVAHAAFMNVLATGLVFWTARKFLKSSLILSTGAGFLTALWFYAPLSWPWFDVTGALFLLAALLFAWKGNPTFLVLSGVFCFMTWLCKANVGLVASLVVPVSLLFFIDDKNIFKKLKKNLFYFSLGYLCIAFLWILWITSNHSLAGAFENLVIRPFAVKRFGRVFLFPTALSFYPPVVISLFFALQGIYLILNHKDDPQKRARYGMMMLLALSQLVCGGFSSMSVYAHQFYSGLLWLFLAFSIRDQAKFSVRYQNLFLFVTWVLLAQMGWQVSLERKCWQYAQVRPEIPVATVNHPAFNHLTIPEPFAQELNQLFRWADSELAPQDQVVIFSTMNLLYEVWNKVPPHPFVFFVPGLSVYKELGDEERLIQALQEKKPLWVIMQKHEEVRGMTPQVLFEYFPNLFNTILKEYSLHKNLDGFSIWKRNESGG